MGHLPSLLTKSMARISTLSRIHQIRGHIYVFKLSLVDPHTKWVSLDFSYAFFEKEFLIILSISKSVANIGCLISTAPHLLL